MLRRRERRRRRMALTSLIDVIFLLLLFFMLSSTFTRFSDVDLLAAGSAGGTAAPAAGAAFLRVEAEGLTLDGAPVASGALAARLVGRTQVYVLASPRANAEALVRALADLQALPGLTATVLQ